MKCHAGHTLWPCQSDTVTGSSLKQAFFGLSFCWTDSGMQVYKTLWPSILILKQVPSTPGNHTLLLVRLGCSR